MEKGTIHLAIGALTIAMLLLLVYVALVNVVPSAEPQVLGPLDRLFDTIFGR